MRFAYTDDQLLFRDTVADLLAKECPPEAVRWAWADDSGRRPELWAVLAEMGVIGLTVPEAHGGFGLGDLDLLARSSPRPVGWPSPGPCSRRPRWRRRCSPRRRRPPSPSVGCRPSPAGEAVATVQLAGQPFVTDAHVADVLVAQRDDRVVAVAGRSAAAHAPGTPSTAPGGSSAPSGTSPTKSSWPTVRPGGRRPTGPSTVVPSPPSALLVGLAEQLLAITVEYVIARQQFGVPIGTFQAVKHHLADCELKLSFARPVVANAAYSSAHRPAHHQPRRLDGQVH